MIAGLRKNTIRLFCASVILFISAAAFFYSVPARSIENENPVRYAVSDDGSVYRSAGGSSWDEISDGLPETIDPTGIYACPGDTEHAYLATGTHGLFRFDSDSESWRNISSPLFKTRTIYNRPQTYRKISAVAIDHRNPSRIICATKHDLYESTDRGESWRPLPRQGISSRDYITSLAVNGRTILAGTSFAGIFLSTGGNFRDINAGLPFEPYSASVRFFDEVTTLCIDPEKDSVYYAGFASGRGVYVYRGKAPWKEEFRPETTDRFIRVDSISTGRDIVIASIGGSLYQKSSGPWSCTGNYPDEPPFSRSSLVALIHADQIINRAFYPLNPGTETRRIILSRVPE